jgi:hypothetical protein
LLDRSAAHTDTQVPAALPARRALQGNNAFAAAADDGTGTAAMDIDMEEQAAGYQYAYSKLATAGTPTRGVVTYAGDMRLHVAQEFTRLLGAEPGVKTLVGLADRTLVGPFFASLGAFT